MAIARAPDAVTLPDGRVLIVGGGDVSMRASAEIYDPATGTFSSTGSMSGPRFGATVTLRDDGRVLIAGGDLGTYGNAKALASAEVFR